jgi:hypothetical protein
MFEYARGVGVHSLPVRGTPTIPAERFAYHVLNLDERTQLLCGELLGPGGVVLTRSAYVRGLDDPGSESQRVRFTVETHADQPRRTPDGREMRLPATLRLEADEPDGTPMTRLAGECHGDWAYGLGAGFVGSYAYEGAFRGRPVSGTAYLEYVDLSRR